jgi:hypothetical protein
MTCALQATERAATTRARSSTARHVFAPQSSKNLGHRLQAWKDESQAVRASHAPACEIDASSAVR